MFDCLDTTPLCSANQRSLSPLQVPVEEAPCAIQMARRYPGRSWLCLWPKPGYEPQLAKAHEAALCLGAEVKWQEDGSLLILDLPLTETLALSQRFGQMLTSKAMITHARTSS